MKIAIDSRYIGKSGIGRVLSGILDNLDYSKNEYYLVGPKKLEELYPSAKVIINETDPFSKKGILTFNKEINKICDLILIPNFIIPYGIKIPVYSYIHDLIFLDMKDTTTSGFMDYTFKKHLFKRCVKKSKKIFCVSNFTIGRCNHYFPKYKDKYILNYPGLSNSIIEYRKNRKEVTKENNIIYVGNVKPHKGINILLDVFTNLNDNKYTLKIIGQKENFLVGINYDEDKYKNVVFTGRLDDDQLLDEISKAKYLVQPSLYEGFGIPPLEALYLDTLPVVSSIDVFKEVYKELSVIYFKDKEDLANIISKDNDMELTSPQKVLNLYNYERVVKTILDNIEV